jgi:hypothetical protein
LTSPDLNNRTTITKRRLPTTPSNLESQLLNDASFTTTSNNSVHPSPYSSSLSIVDLQTSSSVPDTPTTNTTNDISIDVSNGETTGCFSHDERNNNNNYTRGANEILIELNQQLENLNLNIKNQISPKYSLERAGSSGKLNCPGTNTAPAAATTAALLQPHEHVTEWLNSNSLLTVAQQPQQQQPLSITAMPQLNDESAAVNNSKQLVNEQQLFAPRQHRSRSITLAAPVTARVVADEPLIEINLSKQFYVKKNSMSNIASPPLSSKSALTSPTAVTATTATTTPHHDTQRRHMSLTAHNSPVSTPRFQQQQQQQQNLYNNPLTMMMTQGNHHHHHQMHETAAHLSSSNISGYNTSDSPSQQQQQQSISNHYQQFPQTTAATAPARSRLSRSGAGGSHNSAQSLIQYQNESLSTSSTPLCVGDTIQKIRLYKNPKELSSSTLNTDANATEITPTSDTASSSTTPAYYRQRRPSQSLGIDIAARQRLDDLDSNNLAAVISAVHRNGLMVSGCFFFSYRCCAI